MSIPLKYSTATQIIPLGIFVDSTDGDTEEAALTIANTDIKLWKAGASTLASKNLGGGTYISNGIYYCTLDATDTNTYGPLIVFVHVAGALAVKVECEVINANLYAAIYGATSFVDANGRVDVGSWLGTAVTVSATTALPEVDTKSISDDAAAANNLELDYDGTGYAKTNSTVGTVTTLTGHTAQTADHTANIAAILVDTGTTIPGTITTLQADTDDIQTRLPAALVGGRIDADMGAISTSAAAANNLEASALSIVTGACEGTPTTTVIQTDLAEATNDHYIGRIVIFTSGVCLYQATDITGYAGATGTLTVTALTDAPSAADTFVVL